MTKLKIDLTLSDSCSLATSDVSGFFNETTNPYGFIPETNSDTLQYNVYKLSHGYFLNVLLYNKYACTPIISNPEDTMYNILSGNVDNSVYANNFTDSEYTLKQDGTYTLRRFFIPTSTFYDANKNNAVYTGKTWIYTDGETIYKIIDNAPQAITIVSLLATDLSSSTVITSQASFISTCYMNMCYSKVMSTLLDIDLLVCNLPVKVETLIRTRDILYMSLESIKYLSAVNNTTQVQKLIEALNVCGGICATTLRSISATDCGCHG